MAALAPWIFDGVILIFLIICLARGAKKGFVLSLCSLLAIFVAFGGATVGARALAPRVSAALQPRIEQMIEKKLTDEYEPALPGETAPVSPSPTDAPSQAPEPDAPTQPPYNAPTGGQSDTEPGGLNSVLDAIRGLGIYEAVVQSIQDAVSEGFGQAAASVATAAATELAASIAYLVLFVVFFILILLVWTLLSHTLDLVARLPVLHSLNGFLGALLGLVKGGILLFVIAWVLQFFGNVIPEAVVRQTVLLNFFLTANPLALLSGF